MNSERFSRFTWGLLAYVILVISWGAYVRATGSGAGCGSHWPLCNGEVIPRTESLETLIEFTHRLTSGLALIGVVCLLFWAFKVFPKEHPVRRFSVLTGIFMLTEAVVGAGLVLFGLVADDDSIARAWVMVFHLLNTYILLGCIALTAWFSKERPPLKVSLKHRLPVLLAAILVAQLVLGASGAIAALGDTLFPVNSLEEALRQDFSSQAHILVRLRVYHPFLAIFVAVAVTAVCVYITKKKPGSKAALWALGTGLLFLAQLGIGIINLLLLAPVTLQLIHLLFADLIWISTVLMSVSSVSGQR